jgi:hypothetical protein
MWELAPARRRLLDGVFAIAPPLALVAPAAAPPTAARGSRPPMTPDGPSSVLFSAFQHPPVLPTLRHPLPHQRQPLQGGTFEFVASSRRQAGWEARRALRSACYGWAGDLAALKIWSPPVLWTQSAGPGPLRLIVRPQWA